MAVIETEVRESIPRPQINGMEHRATEALPIIYHASTHPLLTPEVQAVLEGMLRVLLNRARQAGVEPSRIEVYGTPVYEEIESRLIVSVWLPLFLDAAFALWDKLSDAIEEWTFTLPETQARILLDRIALEVRERNESVAV